MEEQKRDFDAEAKSWDEDRGRVELANRVVAAILGQAPVNTKMDALDYGCGTGLVTLGISPHVRSITGADSSSGMLQALQEKIDSMKLSNVKTLSLDLETQAPPDLHFDLITSSMAMHHIADVGELIKQLASMLRPNGVLAVSDLDLEGGLFHRDNTGVRHFGFDREKVRQFFTAAGLTEVRDSTVVTFTREVKSGESKEFSVFLISGTKR